MFIYNSIIRTLQRKYNHSAHHATEFVTSTGAGAQYCSYYKNAILTKRTNGGRVSFTFDLLTCSTSVAFHMFNTFSMIEVHSVFLQHMIQRPHEHDVIFWSEN